MDMASGLGHVAFDGEHFEKAFDVRVLGHPGYFEKSPVLSGQTV